MNLEDAKPNPIASIVISTKNRKEDLAKALESCFIQSVPVEVLVMDDGSTDGTGELVRDRFPKTIYHRFDHSEGYIRQRNRGAVLATTPFIFSIEDDATFSTSRVVEQTLAEFNDTRIAAVAIPFTNVNQDDTVRQHAPDRDQIWVASSFIGTAHALRRDVFLRVGGYRSHLIHQGEEMDLCIRLSDSGYVVRLGTADPIHHFESPKRDSKSMNHYGRRNDILFAWHNAPLLSLPIHLAGTTMNGLRFALKSGRFRQHAAGLISGYAAMFKFFSERKPVSRASYQLVRNLKKRGPAPLAEVSRLLPGLYNTRGS